jgi:adenine-specific DNA methylase
MARNRQISMTDVTQPLLSPEADQFIDVPFPSTRFQGSKRGLTEWIRATVKDLPFSTVLDVFGGTGTISNLFKTMGKQVTYNDCLKFNWQIGLALIANADVRLSSQDIELVLTRQPSIHYPTFIHDTFHEIYFTDDENRWLDQTVYNIDHLFVDPTKQALARFALFQSSIIKRPYNLFHRANLYMRLAQVERSFGNKRSWDTPFEVHFRAFATEANRAVFDNHQSNQALNLDALETPIGADLVYLDPPYLNAKGVGVDYHGFYHFLEGMASYDTWPIMVDYKSRHRRLIPIDSQWRHANQITDAFEAVIARHKDSIIVISYRDDGIPSRAALADLLRCYKPHVIEASQDKQYALSKRESHELLLIGC